MSAFDLDAFSNTAITEANDTKFEPIPEAEYDAVCSAQQLKTTPKGQVILELTWDIDDQAARDATGRDKLTSRQDLFLDLTEQGTLDMSKGKNIGLGKLRESLGLNVPGRPFRFGDVVGIPARVFIKHRVTDNGTIYDGVKSVKPR